MKRIIEKLKAISRYCASHNDCCDGCGFFTDDVDETFNCKIMNVISYMRRLNPDEWDFEEIERLLR